ncbi:methyl-accepting chemotaxis protein [Desulfoluna spongiiphila]|uniref:Methyl-accepting chemotaxis protein n=1 Tax=Desulfoluna spongiiphila TaxID=419481 RepID=A0A1G5EMV6_9BACT|nr:methyl-accepting chemotaxis protein [Desulfoluna spongiiphila]SCY28292.1 Methyl-accepting chemotaxis protein [Desulfoluna spongiiphila]
MNKFRLNRKGIVAKTSIYSGAIVFSVLALACFAIIRFQSGMVEFVLSKYVVEIQETTKSQGDRQKKALQDSSGVITGILGGIAGPFINDINNDGCSKALEAFMGFSDIEAVQVMDEDNEPFAAAWKSPAVASALTLPDALDLSKSLSLQADVVFEDTVIGNVTVYYTDTRLLSKLTRSREQALAKVDQFRTTTDERIHAFVFKQILAVMAIILVLTATISICLTRVVIKPLNNVIHNLKEIATGEGDLTVRLDIRSEDELGELGHWFDLFIEKLQAIVKNMVTSAEKVKTSSLGLSRLSEKMKGNADALLANSNTVSAASEEMSSNMSTVAAAMEQTATSVETVATSTESMNRALLDVSRNTGNAGNTTREAVSLMGDASEKVEHLGDAAQRINAVIDIINDISDQTNLLALNATIEAARAGEAGKGFAVVAGEIKELAAQTASATRDIREHIGQIQASTTDTVVEISRINGVIGEVNDTVESIAHGIDSQAMTTKEISEHISQTASGIQEVNKNVNESSLVSGDIAKEMASVNRASEEISASIALVNTSAGELSTLSEHLHGMVGKFNV